MGTKLVVGLIVGIIVLVGLTVAGFYLYQEKYNINPWPEGESPFLSPPLTINGESDIYGLVEQTDFSNPYSPFIILKVENGIEMSDRIVNPGDTIKIYISGTTHIIKPECQNIEENGMIRTIINSTCTETNPDKIFAGWNSYTLIAGQSIKLHVRKISVGNSEPRFEATDDSVEFLEIIN